VDSNQEIIALVNERESEVIQSFRANVENNNSQISKWDFLPASNQPSFILQAAGVAQPWKPGFAPDPRVLRLNLMIAQA
jgi:hypothetical protein